ncbi:MAG: TonB C-terminal domain-containing protein [Labilithrix sp.]|nr:TonB C-terminal domain-containing protein [Labilithrix sp.]
MAAAGAERSLELGLFEMKLPGVPYQPRYTADEMVLGVVVAAALHVIAVGPFVVKAVFPSAVGEEEKPLVARPVVQASLLKLGTPIDPKKLPDRVVPQQRTAPQKQVVASREDPGPKKPDAGPPPPNAQDSDLTNLITKSDPFAEDAGKTRPEEGHAAGVDGGQETDPNKVRAGDMYVAKLGQFFHDRWTFPSVISVGEARRLCTVFQININRNMIIWHVRQQPVRSSGNELFDDSARTMLMKLLDDRTPLPTPPPESDEQFRGRTVQIGLSGDPHGDGSRCR